jgi:serine/threonine protein kinase
MSDTMFGQIGPYIIERPIGHGGMASVFLARDSRSGQQVALKVVHAGTDEDAREILAAEQRGAELQQRFSAVSEYVPKVYESGSTSDYFYIAMEFIAGEDLSQAIHRGRLPWERAVAIAIQLCEFLEDAHRFEMREGARQVLLHNDLKPRNIRLVEGDGIKVLDFGAAKALSLSRKVTRNDFGSTAYLSPECLESGDRDLHSDAWAVGVLLYEMVRGRQPFRADDTRRLEQLILSRQRPESLEDYCPPAVVAIVNKLLAPYPADRYTSSAAIREDLVRVLEGQVPHALAHDSSPTRRTIGGTGDVAGGLQAAAKDNDLEPPTRRTKTETAEAPTRRTITPPPILTQTAAPRRRVPRRLKLLLVGIALMVAMNEACVASRANSLAGSVAVQDFAGLTDLWPQYKALAGRSWLGGAGVAELERALSEQTLVLAERVMANYRTPMPTVRENQWKQARDGLRRAVMLTPGDPSLKAALSYCEGHLHRINGEAAKARNEKQAQEEFAEALVAFREAAALRPKWPDPFLGLARTFIYGLEDVDRGADALAQAEKRGHAPGDRETTQLADGYRARGEALVRTSQTLKDLPQERDYLTRAADAFREALTRYANVSGVGNAAANIRDTQKRLERVEDRLQDISRLERGWPWE